MIVNYVLSAGLVLALSGCMGGGSGAFALHLSDAPNDIEDFSHLNVTITKVRVHATGSDNSTGWSEFDPQSSRVDLTMLKGANETSLVAGTLKVGKYTFVELRISEAVGTFKDSDSGEQVAVQVPSGRLFLNHPFEVQAGKSVDFLFDVTVVKTGTLPTSREYQLKPDAGNSGPK